MAFRHIVLFKFHESVDMDVIGEARRRLRHLCAEDEGIFWNFVLNCPWTSERVPLWYKTTCSGTRMPTRSSAGRPGTRTSPTSSAKSRIG